jgi:FlaA1/EpsC-like NDP-sugar epimerase
MTLRESIKLVMDTYETMKGGELNIPSLPAYRLGDLAAAMGGKQKIIGLPAREKPHESLTHGMSSDIAKRLLVPELVEALRGTGP